MSTRLIARKYAGVRMRDMGATKSAKNQSNIHLVSLAGFVPCRSASPPPVEAYDAWLARYRATANTHGRGSLAMTGAKLRRAIIMRRNGISCTEIAQALGGGNVSAWLARLPAELAA